MSNLCNVCQQKYPCVKKEYSEQRIAVFSKIGIFQLPWKQNGTKVNCLMAFHGVAFLDLINLYIN